MQILGSNLNTIVAEKRTVVFAGNKLVMSSFDEPKCDPTAHSAKEEERYICHAVFN